MRGIDSNATEQPGTSPEAMGPDPESFTEVAQGNILVAITVGLFVMFGLLAMLA